MPTTATAAKELRKARRRHCTNKSRISRIRTIVKKLREVIKSGDKELARDFFRKAQPEIHRGVTKKVLSKNQAANMISKLARRVKDLCLGQQRA